LTLIRVQAQRGPQCGLGIGWFAGTIEGDTQRSVDRRILRIKLQNGLVLLLRSLKIVLAQGEARLLSVPLNLDGGFINRKPRIGTWPDQH
jgi:hypothetical protein